MVRGDDRTRRQAHGDELAAADRRAAAAASSPGFAAPPRPLLVQRFVEQDAVDRAVEPGLDRRAAAARRRRPACGGRNRPAAGAPGSTGAAGAAHRVRPPRSRRQQRGEPPKRVRAEPHGGRSRETSRPAPPPTRFRAGPGCKMPRSTISAHRRRRIGQGEQLEQLVGDPLARQGHQIVGAAPRRLRGPPRPARPAPKRAWKRKKRRMRRWSSAMRVSGSPMKRTRRAAMSASAAEIIVDRAARRLGAERVDREIAPGSVLAPVVGIGDGGAAAVGRDVAAQRRDLDRLALDDRGDGAVGEAGRHRLDPRACQPRHHLFRGEAGGEIDVADLQAEQGVADAAADEAGLARLRVQRGEQPVQPLASAAKAASGRYHAASSSRRARLTIIAAVAPQIRRPSMLDLVIMPLAARARRRASRQLMGGVEQVGAAALRTSPRPRRDAARSGRSGGTTPTTGVTSKPVIVR